jgi:cilia- and flagella-associated protein 65
MHRTVPRLQVFAIENESDVNVPFSVCAPARATFSIEPVCGTLKPFATMQVAVTFTPTFPSNYWKRLCILLANSEPLDIDLYGTGYSSLARPPPIHMQHIDDFLRRVGEGSPILPPSLEEGVFVPGNPCSIIPPGLFGHHSWDLVFDGQDVARGIKASADVLSFKSTSQAAASESQTLSLTNELPFDATVCVHAPRSAGVKPHRAWLVTPESVDLAPGETASFVVIFKPQVDGEYFTSFLEVVAFVKYMRNFRLCSEVRYHSPATLLYDNTNTLA